MTYANVTVTLALVFAMSGGAYAAGRYVITSTRQISPKVLKALAGKPGRNGTNGAPGAQGPAGPAGAKGETGAAGANGTDGTNGTNGVSVTSKAVQPGEAACNKAGGSEFASSSGKTFACNGNPAGLPEVLPAEKTLRGMWAASAGDLTATAKGTYPWATAVSFPLRVENSAHEGPQAKYIKVNEGDPQGCIGSAANPGADPGYLCVFATKEEHVSTFFSASIHEAGPLGFRVGGASSETEEGVEVDGTWAVTAE